MVDDKEPVTPPSPPTPPTPSDGKELAPVDWVKSKLRVDLAKLNPADKEKCAAVESAIKYLLGARNGIAGDLKHFYGVVLDGTAIAAAASTGFAYGPIDNLLSGNYIVERIGRQVKVKHMTIRGWCGWSYSGTAGATVAQGPMPIRMTVFIDRQPLAPLPENYQSAVNTNSTTNDVVGLWMNTINGSNYYPSIMPWNPVTHGFRYKVIKDHIFNPKTLAILVATTTYECTSEKVQFEFHIPIEDLVVTYADDVPNAASQIIKNRICIGVDSDGNGFSQPVWTAGIAYSTDISFVDC